MVYGAARRGDPRLETSVRERIPRLARVLPLDKSAVEVHGLLRASLEREDHSLAELDTLIAAFVVSRDLTLVTGNIRRFAAVSIGAPSPLVVAPLERAFLPHAGQPSFFGRLQRRIRCGREQQRQIVYPGPTRTPFLLRIFSASWPGLGGS
jgi:hypothetical protein